jgi:hypothetical protein
LRLQVRRERSHWHLHSRLRPLWLWLRLLLLLLLLLLERRSHEVRRRGKLGRHHPRLQRHHRRCHELHLLLRHLVHLLGHVHRRRLDVRVHVHLLHSRRHVPGLRLATALHSLASSQGRLLTTPEPLHGFERGKAHADKCCTGDATRPTAEGWTLRLKGSIVAVNWAEGESIQARKLKFKFVLRRKAL